MALIYVVEDDKNISEIESFALKNAGHQIVECDVLHFLIDRKSTRLNSSHEIPSRMPSSA